MLTQGGPEGRNDCKFQGISLPHHHLVGPGGSVRPVELGLKAPLVLHEAGVLEAFWQLSKTGTSKYQRSPLHLSIGCHSHRYNIYIGY
jgi:hypothetical protein